MLVLPEILFTIMTHYDQLYTLLSVKLSLDVIDSFDKVTQNVNEALNYQRYIYPAGILMMYFLKFITSQEITEFTLHFVHNLDI